jgi:hypothetical protein
VPVELKLNNPDEPTNDITKSIFDRSESNLFICIITSGTLKLADMWTSSTQPTNLIICDSMAIYFTHEVDILKSKRVKLMDPLL